MSSRVATSGSAALRRSRITPRRAFCAVPFTTCSPLGRRPAHAPSTTIAGWPSRCRTPASRFAPCRPYSQPSKERHHEMSPRGTKLWNFEQLQQAVADKENIVIVDTREPGELVQTGRIPGAINIPISTHPESFHLSQPEFEAQFDFPQPSKQAELVLYCKAGVRSRAAASLAKEAGWTNIGEYPGSWLDWEKNGGVTQKHS